MAQAVTDALDTHAQQVSTEPRHTMMTPPLPDFLIMGPQKSATTWLYECLCEHPDVLMPESDSIHYFDMYYHRGEEWYRGHFAAYEGEAVVGEETPSYIRSIEAGPRIAESIPDARLIFTLRNPVERAYSHWWHERSKGKHSFEFAEVLENYDLYHTWIEPGCYYRHITRYLEYVPAENIKVCFFDDLVEDDVAYLQEVLSFLNVEEDFVPSFIGEKVNEGKFRISMGSLYETLAGVLREHAPQAAVDAVRPISSRLFELIASQTEYEEGMDLEVRAGLEKWFVNDVRKLADLTGRDLSHWLEHEVL